MTSNPALLKAPPQHKPRLAVALVFLCTILGTAAQILMKQGSQTPNADGPIGMFLAIFTNRDLFIGYVLYGLSTVMLTVAFKFGELSVLYPIIALSYVWVTALSVTVYGEQLNFFKTLGLLSVMAGVAVIGSGMRKTAA
jgi:multidrug transporter EmrE-like cation transporter